jgi:Tfp pilus assembly protein PilF
MTVQPPEVQAALERAALLCDLRRFSEAAEQLRPALAADPQNETGLCLMAQALLGQGDHEAALTMAERAIAVNPDEEWPYRIAAFALDALGRNEAAVAMARSSVRLSPHLAQAHTALARLLASGGRDLEEASAAADQALALAPHDADSFLTVGMVAAARGRIEFARQSFLQALAVEPDSSAAHNELARLQLKHRRFGNPVGLAEAAGGFASALQVDPRAEVSRRNLDLVLYLFLLRTSYAIFVVAWVATRIRSATNAPLPRAIPALLLLVPVFFAGRFLRGLSPSLRSYLGRLLRDWYIAVAVAFDALAALGLVLGAALPDLSYPAFAVAAVLGLLARLTLYLRVRRQFPRRKGASSNLISRLVRHRRRG